MQYFVLGLISLSIFFSCSPLQTNQVRRSELSIKGGRSAEGSWSDNLMFKRVSWYHQATLLYEINVANIDLNSAFMRWFDVGELSSVKDCKQILWIVDYAYDGRRVQNNYVKDLISRKGFVDISVPNFERNFINHSDATTITNKNYKMRLFCNQGALVSSVSAVLPGFEAEEINLE